MRVVRSLVVVCSLFIVGCGGNGGQSGCHTFVHTDLEQLDKRINTETSNGYRLVAMSQGEYQGIRNAHTVLVCK
jgi:hypothetical protein